MTIANLILQPCACDNLMAAFDVTDNFAPLPKCNHIILAASDMSVYFATISGNCTQQPAYFFWPEQPVMRVVKEEHWVETLFHLQVKSSTF